MCQITRTRYSCTHTSLLASLPSEAGYACAEDVMDDKGMVYKGTSLENCRQAVRMGNACPGLLKVRYRHVMGVCEECEKGGVREEGEGWMEWIGRVVGEWWYQ